MIPFIIVPLLVTHRFQDPTLLIKRSGIFFLFTIIALILIGMKKNRKGISNINLKWLGGAYAFILALTVIFSYNSLNPSESYWELLYLSGWISIYACFMIYSTKETMKYIITTSSVVGAILSLLLFNDAFHWISITLPSKGVMSATFGYRNYFGQYLCFAVPAAFISLFMLKTDKARLCMLICCILNMGGLILTRTRAAWLGIFISLLIFTILNRILLLDYFQNIVKNKGYLAILGVLFLLMGYFINISIETSWKTMSKGKGTVSETIKTLNTLNTEKAWGGRLNMYRSTIGIILDYPLLGVGLDNWKLISPKYSNNPNTDSNNKKWEYTKILQRPHNDFLWLLSEVGIIGMVFIIGFLIAHLRLLFKAIKKSCDNEERLAFIFCLISIIAICIESMFDFPRQRTMPNLYLWSIMGFIASTRTENEVKVKIKNMIPIVLVLLLSIVSVFAYFDMKSNTYSQDAKYYNNNNMSKELYASSSISLSYYRNMDYAGTPMYYYLGIAQYKLGDKKTARAFFQEALKIAPYHLGALMNYMIVLGEMGDLDAAYKIMQTIQDVYPRMSKPRLDMSKFFIRAGLYERAKLILLDMKVEKLDDKDKTSNKLLDLVNNN
jgi:O-antigen ligase